MLVVDLHALKPVDLLDFVQQVLLDRPRALNGENVVRVDGAFGQTVTRPHSVTLVHPHVLPDRYRICTQLTGLRRDVHLTLTALDSPERDHTVDLRDNRWVLRASRLEELRNTRETTGDVSGLVHLTTDLRDRITRVDVFAVTYRQLRAHRDDELTQLLFLLGVIQNLNRRVELLLPILDDRHLTTPGGFIELFAHGLLVDDVDEANHTLRVSDDRL